MKASIDNSEIGEFQRVEITGDINVSGYGLQRLETIDIVEDWIVAKYDIGADSYKVWKGKCCHGGITGYHKT